MQHLIIGYGYCGYYLAKELLARDQSVTAISRQLKPEWQLAGLNHYCFDVSSTDSFRHQETVLYYLIPPAAEGSTDGLLKQFLTHHQITAKKIIYFGSSAVYGDHQGAWVNESAPCHCVYERQFRRLDAEQQWQSYAQQHAIDLVLLRIAGIYGPQRLPIAAAQAQTPVINPDQAPYINYISVHDLVAIALQFAFTDASTGIYNIADGSPQKMGYLQQMVAKELNYPPAPFKSKEDIELHASPMKKEFLHGSKRLSIDKLHHHLGAKIALTPLLQGIRASLYTKAPSKD